MSGALHPPIPGGGGAIRNEGGQVVMHRAEGATLLETVALCQRLTQALTSCH